MATALMVLVLLLSHAACAKDDGQGSSSGRGMDMDEALVGSHATAGQGGALPRGHGDGGLFPFMLDGSMELLDDNQYNFENSDVAFMEEHRLNMQVCF
jgi:hypothetical protein